MLSRCLDLAALSSSLERPISQYFQCAFDVRQRFKVAAPLSAARGYFGFGPGIVCYGRTGVGYQWCTRNRHTRVAAQTPAAASPIHFRHPGPTLSDARSTVSRH
jgi:hypothetical protein